MSNERPLDHHAFDLLDTMQKSGTICPICTLVQKGVAAYLDAISYESVNDLDIRRELRKALGYCAAHGQEWLRLQDTLGTAMIYRDVLSTVSEVLKTHVPSPRHIEHHVEDPEPEAEAKENTEQEGFMGRIRGLLSTTGQTGSELGRTLATELEPSAPCPVCRFTLTREKELVDAFAGAIARQDFLEAYRRHETGLCLPHFRHVLIRINSDTSVRALVRAQQTKLALTVADLDEVIRKNDYRNKGEARGGEFKVPSRSVGQAAGNLPTQLNLP